MVREIFFLLFLTKSVFSAVEDVSYFEHLSLPTIKNVKRGLPVSFSFEAHSRTFQLELVPHRELFHPEVQFTYQAENGEFLKFEYDVLSFYTGEVLVGKEKCLASLRIDDQNNLMSGVIFGSNESFAIETRQEFFQGSQEGADLDMVIYKWSDVKQKEKHKCDSSKDVLAQRVTTEIESRQTGGVCTVSMVADSRLFELFGNVLDTTNNLVDVLAASNTLFQSQGVAHLQLISSQVYTDPLNDPFRTASTDYAQFLSAAANTKSQIAPSSRCLIQVRTDYNYNGVLGYAQVGDICESNGGVSITSANSFGKTADKLIQFLSVAHEIGHNFGSAHDLTGNYLMYSSIDENTLQQFSATSFASINQIKATKSSCFINNAPFGYCGNGVVDDGEQCDCGTGCSTDTLCNADCTLKPSAQCDPRDGKCCTNSGSFMLEGSVCGVSPIPGVPAPTCTGNSGVCPSCYPGNTHPCDKYTNLRPCDIGRACKAGCAYDGQSQCYASNLIPGITEANLPDGTCCPGGTCVSGTCVVKSSVLLSKEEIPSTLKEEVSSPTTKSTMDQVSSTKAIWTGGLFKQQSQSKEVSNLVIIGIVGSIAAVLLVLTIVLVAILLLKRRKAHFSKIEIISGIQDEQLHDFSEAIPSEPTIKTTAG